MRGIALALLLGTCRGADPLCEDGLAEHDPMQVGDACCAQSCGRCGGSGCSKLPGGASACCGSEVRKSGTSCDSNNAPCVVNGSTPTPSPTPTPPAQDNVTVSLGDVVVSETDDRYVGWTIDLTADRQFFEINFTNSTLRYLASQLPTFTRVGGSGQDYIGYDFDGQCSGLCLNTTQWDNLHSFITDSGSKMVFGLNECHRNTNIRAGRRLTTCDSTAGVWDGSQAKTLLEYAKSHGQEIFGLELGNERDSQVSATDQAKDFAVLNALLTSVYPDPTSRPKILGPDAHSFKDKPDKWVKSAAYIKEFMETVAAEGIPMYAVTHHEYIEVVNIGDTPTFNDPAVLNRSARIAQLFNETVAETLPGAQRWGGEIGPHNGGSSICNHEQMRWANFADSIWYADSLGAKARYGYQVYMRQDFVGIDYGLLDCVDHTPLPDYYVAVLFNRLMGTKVLTTGAAPTDMALRSYAHCSRNRGATTLLLVHLGIEKPHFVTLPSAARATAYVLTAPGGDRLSTGVELNGKLLEFTSVLPELRGVDVDVAVPLALPPLSVAFVELEASASACGEAVV